MAVPLIKEWEQVEEVDFLVEEVVGWLGLIVTAMGAVPYIISQFRQIKKPAAPTAFQLNNQPVPATTPEQERKQLENQLAELKQQMDTIGQRLAELK